MDIKDIVKQAKQAERLIKTIEKGEVKIKEQKAKLRKMLVEDIPSAFAEMGMTSVELKNGTMVGLKQIFAVNMPAAGTIVKAKPEQKKKLIERLDGCVKWLRKNKGADLIQNSVLVNFGAGNDKTAKELFTELSKRKLHPIKAMLVHPGTLKSFLREKWNNDVEIPVELFETYTGQEAEFVLPKSPKGGKAKAAK